MSACGKLILLFYLVSSITGENEDVQCNSITTVSDVKLNCIGLTGSISRSIKNAPKNSTWINIADSTINIIPRFSFAEFTATLKTLYLERCGITSIELDGFSDLYQLEKLVLRENKLTRITGESFTNLWSLRYLDVSFNEISSIDTTFYQPQRFPALQYFHFDYNKLETIDYSLFPVFGNLQQVKFGKNPWKWGYRMLLTQQLENARIDYRDDWEEWGWMYTTAQECETEGIDKIPSLGILDCVIAKLLRADIPVENSILRLVPKSAEAKNLCVNHATELIDCYIRSSPPGDPSILRRTFEGLAATLTKTGLSSGKF